MARTAEPVTRAGVMYYSYSVPILQAVLLQPGEALVQEMVETLAQAEQSGEDVALGLAQSNLGIALVYRGGDSRAQGLELLTGVRESALRQRHSRASIPLIDAIVASDRTRQGDLDGAIELSRTAMEEELNGGGLMWTPMVTGTLVDALLRRGAHGDLDDAQAAIDRVAAVPVDPGLVLYEIWLLRMRSLMAQARGEDVTYRGLSRPLPKDGCRLRI